MVICVIGALTLYMGLLMLLDSWFRRGRTTTTLGGAGNSRWNYQEQTNEVSTETPADPTVPLRAADMIIICDSYKFR